MSLNDPIADFLTRIRNGIRARKLVVSCPRSNLNQRIAEILRDEGYLDHVARIEDTSQGVLTITLRYNDTNEPAITGIRRISRPGQREYVNKKRIPKVRNGLGVAVMSTSRGVMSDRDARKLGVGGEVLCEVW